MKTERYYVILMVLIGILCLPALCGVDLPQADDNMVFVKVNPTLMGVKHLLVSVRMFEPGIDTEKWSDKQKLEFLKTRMRLEKRVSDKLNEAGIKALPGGFLGSFGRRHNLCVRLNMLKLSEENMCVFHVQTSLQAHYLPKDFLPDKPVKVNVWESDPVMRAVPQEKKQATITKMVMEQIETFIDAYLAANPPDRQTLDVEQAQGQWKRDEAVAMFTNYSCTNFIRKFMSEWPPEPERSRGFVKIFNNNSISQLNQISANYRSSKHNHAQNCKFHFKT